RFVRVLAAVLDDGLDLVEDKLNGGVFALNEHEKTALEARPDLREFARLIDGMEDETGQFSLWRRYSFRDLPVELISHVYQLFVENSKDSVYTPPALVRLLLDEVLGEARLDRILETGEVILDPACGSGIFLVESYKRLVNHWRSRNDWARPGVDVLRDLIGRVRGVDRDHGAVELAAFSLCLALCDELEPEEIRRSDKLFPDLIDRTIVTSCFFSLQQSGGLPKSVGLVIGNPPFDSDLKTAGAKIAGALYEEKHGTLPDKQVAFLFLHEGVKLLAPGGHALPAIRFRRRQCRLDRG
ncbi:MAG: N-6 DNA methylase, partial [Sphingomonas bacterium]|nr:N-6 DNA methylase [Sphingomonas bacterium]